MSTLAQLVADTQTEAGATLDTTRGLLWAEDGFRLLIHDGGGLTSTPFTIALVPGQVDYPLPTDWRSPLITSGRLVFPPYAYSSLTTASVTLPGFGNSVNIAVTAGTAPSFRLGNPLLLTKSSVAVAFLVTAMPNNNTLTCVQQTATVLTSPVALGATVAQTLAGHGRELDFKARQQLEHRAGFRVHQGTPWAYYYNTPFVVSFDPVPDGVNYQYAAIDYRQDVTAERPLNPAVDLGLPAWTDPCLRAYIKAENNKAAGGGAADPVFLAGVARWKAASEERTGSGQTSPRRRHTRYVDGGYLY